MVAEEQVHKAIERLLRQGINPTVEGVRGITGGSRRDLAPILRAWRVEQTQKTSEAVRDLLRRYKKLKPDDKSAFLRVSNLAHISPTEAKRRDSVPAEKRRK